MNKVVNSISILLLLAYAFFAFGSINDLGISVYMLRTMPFLNEIIHGLTILILFLGLIRVKRRWEGVRDIKAFKKFNFSTPLSRSVKGMGTMFFLVEIIFMTFFVLLGLNSQLLDQGTILFPMFAVLGVFITETIIFLIKYRTEKSTFKIGVNENLVAYFDREMYIYYFDGLQQISVYQNRLHFKYKLELHMFMELDLIPEEELLNFKAALSEVLKEKDVFFDESYREMGVK